MVLFITQVIRPENSDNWTLQIKFAQIRDGGMIVVELIKVCLCTQKYKQQFSNKKNHS